MCLAFVKFRPSINRMGHSLTRSLDKNSLSINLAFAFLDPVKGSDIAAKSIERLRQFDTAIVKSYAIDGEFCVFNAYPPARNITTNIPPPGEVWTYGELSAFATAGYV
jgi:hypothetical protein